ncbi:hypothetical protein LTR37_001999 [Vermiconidia calcicola]|uniref:Uncharacterized protein n=1 Tax=Vermiconidia calcicola TaxID=1690605 RepID=A0ACC3NUP2_9PEZI|nr:hypothetical protein LTR37_001999 [Vermiconidia calcicola]
MAQQQSRLLSLPPEIRNRIYHYVLAVNNSIDSEDNVAAVVHDGVFYMYDTPSVLSMLQVCQQLHNEAEATFYAINWLELPPRGISGFTQSISTTRLSAIHRIYIRGIAHAEYLATVTLKSLCAMPHLHTLHLSFDLDNGRTRRRLIETLAKDTKLDVIISKLPSLRHIEISIVAKTGPADTKLQAAVVLRERLQRAIVCGRITRIVREAWRAGTVKLKAA